MGHKETRKTGELTAIDSNGMRYTIIKYTEFFIDRLLDGSTQTLPGLDEYQLENGEPVNKISDTEYFAVLNEITLHPI